MESKTTESCPDFQLLDKFVRSNKLSKAKELIIKLNDETPSVATLLLISKYYCRKSKDKKEQQYLLRAHEIDPENSETNLLLYQHYTRSEDNTNLSIYRDNIQFKEHTSAADFCALGYLALHRRDPVIKSKSYFEKSLEIDPEHIDSLFGLFEIQRFLSFSRKAIKCLGRILALQPENLKALKLLCQSHLHRNEPGPVSKLLKEMSSLCDLDDECRLLRVEYYFKSGQFKKAIESLSELRKSNNLSSGIYFAHRSSILPLHPVSLLKMVGRTV